MRRLLDRHGNEPLRLARRRQCFGLRVPSRVSFVRSASTTHRRSRFAFSDRDIATAAIETPAWQQAATASALNSALYRRRRRRSTTIVFTCPPHCEVHTYTLTQWRYPQVGFPDRLRTTVFQCSISNLNCSSSADAMHADSRLAAALLSIVGDTTSGKLVKQLYTPVLGPAAMCPPVLPGLRRSRLNQ